MDPPFTETACANAAGVGSAAEPRINVARARMPVAPAFLKLFFFELCKSKGELLLMTMQLLRHVAYQSEGGQPDMAYQLFRDEMHRFSSGFADTHTEIRRNVMDLRLAYPSFLIDETNQI